MESLYDLALEAINKMFSDLSVEPGQTRDNLQGLIVEIEVMLTSLGELEE